MPFPSTEKHLISPVCFSTIIETELYRDVQGIYCGDSVALESAFDWHLTHFTNCDTLVLVLFDKPRRHEGHKEEEED